MGRRAVTVAILGFLAACTQEVDDPSFNDAGASAETGSSGSSSSEGDGEASNTQGSNSNTSATTNSDESSSGAGSTSGADTGGSASATTGASGCGDGTISPGEQCDGADLQGFDCVSLGLSGGTLLCDPITCTFDTSMCMSTTSGTSG
jgi:hypothetical protein